MSRVFDTPRYKHQTLSRVALTLGFREGGFDDIIPLFSNEAIRGMKHGSRAFLCGCLNLNMAFWSDPRDPDEDEYDDEELFMRYSYLDGVQKSDAQLMGRFKGTADLLHGIITRCKPKKIYTDDEAMMRFVHGYLSGKYLAKTSPSCVKRWNLAAVLAREIAGTSSLACRHGNNVLEVLIKKVSLPNTACKTWERMTAWAEGMEKLRMSSMTPKVHEAHEAHREKPWNINPKDFRCTGSYAENNLGCDALYRCHGLFLLSYGEDLYIFDHSSMIQVQLLSRAWEGTFNYATNYRKCGNLGLETDNFLRALEGAVSWLCNALVTTNFNMSLARSMKQSVALMQNELHKHSEHLETNTEQKSANLREAIAGILPLDSYWHDHLSNAGISDRAKMDLANLYYNLPSPDADLESLWKKGAEIMCNASTADPEIWKLFMNYSKALDFCKLTAMIKEVPKHRKKEGYEFEESQWFKSCLKGKMRLPPDEEMGNVWIYHHFEFQNTLSEWYWEAGDVTHVHADLANYTDQLKATSLTREDCNELLYAMDYAPLLSKKYSPSEVLDRVCTGKKCWDSIALMAAKSENTKPGAKVRETWSGDDVTRELTSCYDRQAIPLGSMYRGMVSRKPPVKVDAMFDRIADLTTKPREYKTIIISNDVSGWSPQGDRKAWAEHHDYVVHTSDCPEGFNLLKIWSGISSVLSRRGFLAVEKLQTGLFQGWTGTCDTTLNIHASLFCVRAGKRAGYLDEEDVATTAGLIDDAMQGLEFKEGTTVERAQNAADRHFETTCRMWKGLAAEIDQVKTLYSSIKVIFLNRLYCEGAEVLTPMKVYARVDRELTRRFSTVYEQVDTILGGFRSASERGADPMVCYIMAIYRSLDLIIQSSRGCIHGNLDVMEIVNAAFAPRGLGGWGLPHMTGWLTQESQDKLTAYLGVIFSLNEYMMESGTVTRLSSYIYKTLNQTLAEATVEGILDSPRDVRVGSLVGLSGAVLEKVKREMAQRAKSPIFRAALNSNSSEVYRDAMMRALKSCTFDASVLEVIGSITPRAQISALVDRAHRNDLTASLLPYRVKSSLSKVVQANNRAAIGHLFAIQTPDLAPMREYIRFEVFQTASAIRERYYEENGLSITNHTLPDYGTLLTRSHSTHAYILALEKKGITSHCSDLGDDDHRRYRNMYDGIPEGGKMRAPRSRGVYSFDGETSRALTPGQRAFRKAGILGAHVDSRGGDGASVVSLCLAQWGIMNATPAVRVTVQPGTSLKRVSLKTSHRTHSIACFPNAQGIIAVDTVPLGRYLSENSTNTDFMSFATAARALGLIEVACGVIPRDGLVYGASFGSFPLTNDDVARVHDEETFREALRTINEDAPEWVRDEASTIVLASASHVMPGDDDVEVEYVKGGVGITHEIRGPVMAVGSICLMLSSGIQAAPSRIATRKRKAAKVDESEGRHVRDAATSYRKYRESLGDQEGALLMFMEQILHNMPKRVPLPLVLARWQEVGAVLEASVPNWATALENSIQCVKNLGAPLGAYAAAKITGRSYHGRILARGINEDRAEAATLCAHAYLAVHGRPSVKETYNCLAMLGFGYINRCWRVAAQRRQCRKENSSYGASSRIIGMMYAQISNVAGKEPGKETLMRAMAAGLETGLASETNGGNISIHVCTEEELVDEVKTKAYAVRVSSYIARHAGLDMQSRLVVEKDIEQVLADIRVLGTKYVLPRPALALGGGQAEDFVAALPDVSDMFVQPIQMEPIEDETADIPVDMFNHCVEYYLYTERGAVALRTYRDTGVLPEGWRFNPGAVDLEEVNNWMEEEREYEAGQHGDEVEL
ncbi:RNA-dependent RNA polymerase [Hubei qinvirus-like virus 1]|uniref:RNA-dependent RNA polymerase n=1 Tax=Hubei qinvirus-like virus 1 TaxID=1938657 RepID=A0A1L3KL69_9VIRU|nr:RNA-dependent RNA polymerase [Hubei qinvirus-like virus 1]APG78069.1 RNA-dependent RNA polymerase [Hubei qinvirus-like virus 1]